MIKGSLMTPSASEIFDEEDSEELPVVKMPLAPFTGRFGLLASFALRAVRAGWPQKAVDAVWAEAMAGDDIHVIKTLRNHTTFAEEPDA
jgi:hypothetical protein